MATERRTFQKRIIWRLIIAVLVAFSFIPIIPRPAAALDIKISDYFTYTYSIQFSKSEVARGEPFYATIQAQATFIAPLPIFGAPSEASSTGRIVATHQASGTKVTLNPSYTVTVSPFPSLGQSVSISQSIPLQFPDGSPSGVYSVAGELIKAIIKVPIIDEVDVTSRLPSSQNLGSITYLSDSPAPPAPATPPPAPTTSTAPTPTPSSTPAPTTSPAPAPTPSSPPPPTTSPSPATPTTPPTSTLTPIPNPTPAPTPAPTSKPASTTPSPTTPITPPLIPPIDWKLIGGITAGIIILILVIRLLVRLP